MINDILRIKIISIGNISSGKSCVIKRFCEKRFVSKYMPTIGIDYGVTRLNYDGKEIRVNIFDMSGNPYYHEIRNEFYENTQGIMLFYDVANRKSFESLNQWVKEAKGEIDSEDLNSTALIVIGNKVDKNRMVSRNEGECWASRYKFPYFETSAKSGIGINNAFNGTIKSKIYKNSPSNIESGKTNIINSINSISTQELSNCIIKIIIDKIKADIQETIPGSLNAKPAYSDEQIRIISRIINKSTSNLQKLGLQHGATIQEIKRAYRKLAILLHPDKSLAPRTAEAFDQLTNAKSQLLNDF
ncbi:DnaJ subfamily C member 27 [Intoshia linei]|uniref:DnaJ subfamily C member 27 n=1 Tax=Intoshia linei TaxID=1819745 RepID=A0A177BCV6_9BILA|nr:DnaJ subfamily C member 27 [Intoshia linei]